MDAKFNNSDISISQKIGKIRGIVNDAQARDKKIYNLKQFSILGQSTSIPPPENIDKKLIEEYLNDSTFVYNYLLCKMPEEFPNLSDKFKNDKNYVIRAVENDESVLKYVAEEFKNDKKIITSAIEKNYYTGGNALKYINENFKNDKQLVLLAVKKTGTAIQYASESLKNDKEVIFEALFNTKKAFQYLSENLKDNKNFVLEAINKPEKRNTLANEYENNSILQYVSDRLKDDKKVVLASLQNESNFSLEDVSERLKNDKDIVLQAVIKKSNDLKYASEDLRNDREVVYAAIKRRDQNFDSELLTYASKEIQNIVNEKGLRGLKEKPFSKLSSIINNLRDLTFGNESSNRNKYGN